MSSESAPQQPQGQDDRIRRLIESGEAINERDAALAIAEEREAGYFRGLERARAVAVMRADIAELDRRWASREAEPLSPEDQRDRYDIRFQLAIVETAADDPNERELLFYEQSLDVIGNDLGTGPEFEINASAQRRLQAKAAAVRERIGEARARELLDRYRANFQALMSDY